MKRLLGSMIATLILAGSAQAQQGSPPSPPLQLTFLGGGPDDHLYPADEPVLEHYQALVLDVLREAFGSDRPIRVLVEPSFEPEFVVGLTRNERDYSLFVVRARTQLWRYELADMMDRREIVSVSASGENQTRREAKELRRNLPRRPTQVRLDRCARPIDAKLAENLVVVWTAALKGVGPQNQFGLDGTSYYFSADTASGVLSGKTWSPEPSTPPGRLVKAADLMRSYCERGRPKDLDELRRLVVALGTQS